MIGGAGAILKVKYSWTMRLWQWVAMVFFCFQENNQKSSF
ncbi:hypothetical protein IGI53_000940 [Enterococcus sp. DIV0788_1]